MDNISKLIQSISSLLWPIIGFIILWNLRESLKSIIDSAKGRKFTVKIGGQELTMDQASEIQANEITELRNQIIAIQQSLEANQKVVSSGTPLSSNKVIPTGLRRILWVDDKPKNNSYLISALNSSGYTVDLARTTEEGLRMTARNSYGLIISDMGRDENGAYVLEAGLELLKKLRATNIQTPYVVYTTPNGVRNYNDQIKALGGLSAISSSTALYSLIQKYIPPTIA